MRRPLCLPCVFYVVTVMIFPRLFLPRDSEKIPPGGAYVVYTGEVYAIENQDDKSVVYLKSASAADSETVLVSDIICYFGDTSFTSGLKIGNWARIGGTCRPFRSAANDGQFDAKQYYRILEWDFAMTGCEGSVTDETYRAGAQALYLIRERLAESFDRGLPSEDAGVMKAMLLGQKKDLDDEIKGLYQRNGIAHILAISGLHITFLGMGMYRLCKKAKLPSAICALLSLCFIIGFGRMTGSGASTVRSIIMFSLFLLAGICGRTYDMLTAAAVSAAVLLIYRPQYVYHSGFLLSFGAIMGIALVAPFLRSIFPEESPTKRMLLPKNQKEKLQKKLHKKISSSLITGSAVLIATLPVQLSFFYTASPYSCFLNLLVLPFTGALLAAGFFGSVSGCIFPGGCPVFLLPCRIILSLYEMLCRGFDNLPGGQLVIGSPAAWKTAIYYGTLLALLLWGKRLHKRVRARILMAALLLLCIRVRTVTSCTMLDVGQGDGIVVEEKGGGTVMIDGGSSDVSQVGKYRIVPYLKSHGIGRLDYVFVSHGDRDHISGIEEILEDSKNLGVRINCLVLTKFAAEDEAYEELLVLAKQNGVRVLLIGAGDYIALGETRFTCVYPETNELAEGNDQSMVLMMECGGIKTLFTGDLTEEKEAGRKWEDVDVLKVGHHGSRYSSGEDFLRQCQPEVAVISAGEDNSYGHPHEETLKRLVEAGAESFTTKESGAVTIRYRKGKYSVFTHGKM